MKQLLGMLVVLTITQFATAEQSKQLFVKGELNHIQKEYTYPGEFKFQKDSKALVVLQHCENIMDADPHCKTIARQEIKNITQFPIEFELSGVNPEQCAEPGYVCSLSAQVLSDGQSVQIGDLVSEYQIDFRELPVTNFAVEVTGLESCQAPYAGGYCL